MKAILRAHSRSINVLFDKQIVTYTIPLFYSIEHKIQIKSFEFQPDNLIVQCVPLLDFAPELQFQPKKA